MYIGSGSNLCQRQEIGQDICEMQCLRLTLNYTAAAGGVL
jgi:hypothetical protein